MNETELYFARQNLLWNLGIYVLLGIAIIFLIGAFIIWIKDKFEYLQKHRAEKKRGKHSK